MPDHNYFANLIWQIAGLLRGPYRPPQYERVMLPMTVLRRFDCVLASSKAKVLAEDAKRKGGKVKGEALDRRLNNAAGQRFHNHSPLDFEKLKGDPDNIDKGTVRRNWLELARCALQCLRMKNPFRYFKTSPEIIRLAVMMYVRFPLSLRNVEDLLHERGIEVSHETIRFWWNRFGTIFAIEIRKKRTDRIRAFSGWRWHLDEVFVKINGERHYLWRAVDHEGEVLEAFVSKKRDCQAVLKFLRKLMKRSGRPDAIVTDRLRSLPSGFARAGRIRSATSRPLAEQSGGEFTPAVPATRTRHAPFQADAKPPEIRRCSFFHLQPLQSATTPLLTGQFQAQPRRRARPVASARGGLIPCRRWRTQTYNFPLTVPK